MKAQAPSPSIVRFRRDLRLEDNPALHGALRRGGPVVPVYVWAPEEEGAWPPGSASRWWLHHWPEPLDEDLASLGSRLIVRRGPSAEALREVAAATGAGAVLWNRLYEPAALDRDREVERLLRSAGLETASFNASLLFEPWDIGKRSGGIAPILSTHG